MNPATALAGTLLDGLPARARYAGLILDNRRALFEIVLIELLINVTRRIGNRGNSGNTGNTPSQT